MPMTPDMGPRRQQSQSPEDRIRALMQGLGGAAAAAGAVETAGGLLQKMPFNPSDLPTGPILKKLPYIPSEQPPGPILQKMPYRPANPYMHKTVPRDIRIN